MLMCSILITNKAIDQKLEQVNKYLKLRGPDATNIYKQEGITFVHNLLSMTGEFTPQPFIDDEVVCLFNGEIYNYLDFGSYSTDGECLIPLYREFGEHFVKQLDGEFTLCLIDFKAREIIISSDVFAVKPLWFSFNSRWFGISSYESALLELNFPDSIKLKANTTYIFNLDNFRIKKELSVYDFDLKQHKNTYDDWVRAFEQSIKKRYITSKQKVFIGLSSGYDSGAIACELSRQGVDFHAYSSLGSEHVEILEERHRLIKKPSEGFIFKAKRREKKEARNFIIDNVEDFKYRIYSDTSDYNEFALGVCNDRGSIGMSFISSVARENKRRIYISGMGADEIFSDYGFAGEKKFKHSNFGGLYPDNLETIFPWASFYESSMLSYLMKEEYVSGAYGLEGRYPYLDKNVVQEFLWLTSSMKNQYYKSVLYHYLKTNNYPFKEGEKRGFEL
jgi:asparagine synthetase B (glutamine-hydrolysing)